MELNLDAYRKALGEMPKAAHKALAKLEREALSNAKKLARAQEKLSQRAASAVTKHARDQARAAKKAAAEAEAAYNEQFSSIMGLSGAAFGGVAGDVEDAFTAIQGMNGGLALAGVALAGIAVGGAALVSGVEGMRAIMDAATEATARLDEMGVAVSDVATAQQAAALDAYTAAMADLETVTDAAAVRMGADLAPAATKVEQALTGLQLLTTGTADETGGLVSGVMSAAEAFVMWNPAISPIIGLMQGVVEEEGKASAAAVELARDTRDLASAFDDEGEALFRQLDALGLTTYGYNQLTPEVEKAKSKEAEYKKVILANAKAQGEEAVAVREAREALAEYGTVVHDTMGTQADAVAFNMALIESDTEVARTAEEKAEAYAKSMEKMGEAMRYVQGIGGEAANALAGFSNLAMQGAEREAAAKKKSAKSIGATIKGLEKQRAAATGAELVRIQERIYARQAEQDNMRKLAAKANKRALNAWKAGKAAQISATIMNGISAGIAFLAPPPMGLGPVAGGVAAGLLAGSVTAAVAEIAAQKPPKFHQGGIVAPPRQEVGALLETGEGVIRREAMMQPGATETVQRMNEGGAVGGQPMAVYLNDRLVAVLVARAERTAAQSRRGLAMVGTRTMYDRRR